MKKIALVFIALAFIVGGCGSSYGGGGGGGTNKGTNTTKTGNGY